MTDVGYGPLNGRPAPMSVDALCELLHYNPETGGFIWARSPGHRVMARSLAGTVNSHGYVAIKIGGVLYKAHRLAWYISTGVWPAPGMEIDHINGAKGDNRLINLRLVTRSANQKNIPSRLTWRPKERVAGPQRFGRGVIRPAPMPVGDLRAILAYDRETGLLTWARDCGGKDGKRIKAGARAGGYNAYGYLVVRINKVLYQASRIAWYIATGEWPDGEIDHRNNIRDDNRFENLRVATRSENNMNRRPSLPNTSGYRGVVRWGGKWRAQIRINGRNTGLGTFATPEAAHEAYCAAAREHHGAFARID